MRDSRFEGVQQYLDDDPPPTSFNYFLSAFISAARSVPWVMRSEYGKVEGWERWYEVEEQLEEDQALLNAFTELRNSSEKTGHLFPSRSPSFKKVPEGDPSLLQEADRKKPRMRMKVQTVTPPVRTLADDLMYVDEVTWRILHLGDQDLLAACGRYVRMLELLVRKCERLFGTSPMR